MGTPTAALRRPLAIFGLVTLGGAAALCWEGLWQLRSSLALGVSALGTAITLAATMTGMTAGGLVAGRWLQPRVVARPTRLYGLLELVIGASGLAMLSGFAWLEQIDTSLYRVSPTLAPVLHVAGIAMLLGPPTFAMGASLPLFELMARSHRTSIALLYGLNTAGASAGLLLSAFVLIPSFGVARTCLLVAGANLAIFLVAQLLEDQRGNLEQPRSASPPSVPFRSAVLLVFVTGFTTFGLEVTWFRSLRASFLSTTESFAIMLASVLIPLALAAQLTPWLRPRVGVGVLVSLGSLAILLCTPLVERMDRIAAWVSTLGISSYGNVLAGWFLISLAILGPAVFLVGTALPRLLDEFSDTARAGVLYGLNTLGAVCGALLTAWLLLPWLGFARSAWLLGLGLLPAALLVTAPRARLAFVALATAGLGVAVSNTSSLGRERVQSLLALDGARVVDHDEGPDATVSVVQMNNGRRVLLIDGFVASGDYASTVYMEWMGRLPALLHRNPQRTLVIAFGTGLTAHSLREETLGQVDIVEISPAVLRMAPHFPTNQGVLDDPRVRAITMDGRAWARRTTTRYDAITLEPMPPHLAGMNGLYSKEFYEVLAGCLEPEGIVAQWVPLHLLPPFHAASVAAAFVAVFPDAALWVDPTSATGILVGRRAGAPLPLGSEWPGLSRDGRHRSLSGGEIRRALELGPEAVARWAREGEVVTDDNQLLAYGIRAELWSHRSGVITENVSIIRSLVGRPLLYDSRGNRRPRP